MKLRLTARYLLLVQALVVQAFLLVLPVKAQTADTAITSHYATINGVKLHYLQAGHGPTLILIHGFAETSLMWKPAMPIFAKKFTVIAPDLPGIGDSAIPTTNPQFKTVADTIHSLVKSLGVSSAEVVGHDIGLMVAYAYAAQFPTETTKLVLMDAFLPGVGNWHEVYDNPKVWHFRFNGPIPEALVAGRERIYFAQFWDGFAADKNHSIPEADREAYLRAYSRPGRMRASWAYFIAFPQTAKDFAQFAQTKLPMPILVIAGEKAGGTALAEEVRLVGSNVKVDILKNTGHWVMEENRPGTMAALQGFL
jgi:pimeloyl-ACP methyl ester carboxylesterase